MAKMSSVRILFDASEVEAPLLSDLYRTIALACGFPFDDENFRVDCTKVNIANNIQDNIYEAYRRKFPEEYAFNPAEFDTQITMQLCLGGPKVDKDLPENTVEVFYGAFDLREVTTPFFLTKMRLGLSVEEMKRVVAYYSAVVEGQENG